MSAGYRNDHSLLRGNSSSLTYGRRLASDESWHRSWPHGLRPGVFIHPPPIGIVLLIALFPQVPPNSTVHRIFLRSAPCLPCTIDIFLFPSPVRYQVDINFHPGIVAPNIVTHLESGKHTGCPNPTFMSGRYVRVQVCLLFCFIQSCSQKSRTLCRPASSFFLSPTLTASMLGPVIKVRRAANGDSSIDIASTFTR